MALSPEQKIEKATSSTDKGSLRTMRDNAVRAGDAALATACDRRLQQLDNSNYLGAFRDELVTHLASKPGRRMDLELPLADEKGGAPRAPAKAELSLDQSDSICVKDVSRDTYHSSLSDLRGEYVKTGGGSESWGAFRDPVSKHSIADILGVDPDKAHESRKSKRK